MGTIAIATMNNRDYKQFAPGEIYHVYNRGNGKMDIFRDPQDYRFVHSRVHEYLRPSSSHAGDAMVPIALRKERRKSFPQGAFSLVAYCYMPNHFHFLIRQNGETSITALMLNLWTGYSKYFNKKYDRVGSLFQDQFKAIHVDEDRYLKYLSAYIHQNPTVARMVAKPEDYEYSSCRDYLSGEKGICEPEIVLEQFENSGAYRDFLNDSFTEIRDRKDLQAYLADFV